MATDERPQMPAFPAASAVALPFLPGAPRRRGCRLTSVTETPVRPSLRARPRGGPGRCFRGRSGQGKSPSTTSRSHPWVSRSMRRRARSSASPPLGTAKPWRWKKLAFSRWTSATKRVRSHRTAFSGRSRRVASLRVRWTSVVALAMAALQLSEHARDALGGRFRAVAGVYSRGPERKGEGERLARRWLCQG